MQVELGDYVEVDSDEGLTWVVEILEMFETTEVCTKVSSHPVTNVLIQARACTWHLAPKKMRSVPRSLTPKWRSPQVGMQVSPPVKAQPEHMRPCARWTFHTWSQR